MGRADKAVLKGRCQTYRYQVAEMLVADPDESSVMEQLRGRDVVSLQSCTPIPTFEQRLVARADRT